MKLFLLYIDLMIYFDTQFCFFNFLLLETIKNDKIYNKQISEISLYFSFVFLDVEFRRWRIVCKVQREEETGNDSSVFLLCIHNSSIFFLFPILIFIRSQRSQQVATEGLKCVNENTFFESIFNPLISPHFHVFSIITKSTF